MLPVRNEFGFIAHIARHLALIAQHQHRKPRTHCLQNWEALSIDSASVTDVADQGTYGICYSFQRETKFMRLKDIEARNAEARDIIRQTPEGIDIADHPQYGYFGYYEVDIFECPTFLMFTNNDCPRGWDILFLRHFEPQSMALWCRLAHMATGIIDIGAHVGVYSLAAAALRDDIKIHAFEPNPHAFSRLRMHKQINSFAQIVEHTAAVADQNGFSQFNWAKKATSQISSGGSLVERENDEGIEKLVVRVATLDGTGLASTLGQKPLVKIDVEGAETSAFRGIQEILALKPDIILETFSQSSCDEINEIIRPLQYDVYHILEKERQIEQRKQLEPCKMEPGGSFNQLLTCRPISEIAEINSHVSKNTKTEN